jgi:cyclophilin family peptidyl-prolyl cis-trans isomerase
MTPSLRPSLAARPRLTRFRASVVGLAAVALLVGACTGGDLPPIPDATPTPSATPEPSTHPSIDPSPVVEGCPTSQPDPLPAGEVRDVTIATSQGTIVIRVEGELSPIAAGNFVALAECGYYDGVVFHRLVPGFVIQGGDGVNGRSPNVDPDLVGTGGPGYTIEDEPVTATYGRGVVAMARTPAPNSQGSQFFIVLDDRAEDALASYNTYAIFGTVIEGMDTVDTIAAMPNSGSPNNAALEPVAMDEVTVSTP